MTARLYYNKPELGEFQSVVDEVIEPASGETRSGVVLRDTAFYPTSGGQVHDTGWLITGLNDRLRVVEVTETEDGKVVHYLDPATRPPVAGATVFGNIDSERRRDHMQQHSGQHVLSAALIELYQMPTVSFHMGDDYSSIDLAAPTITPEQVVGAEKRANEIIFENRPVHIRYVTRAEAESLGLRKLPPADRDELRLIEIQDFDLSACGGTHVAATGKIGSILLRKIEKVRQGVRIEFVCGDRAVRIARRDFTALTEASALFSTQLWDVPAQIRKGFEDQKQLRRQRDDALEQLADAMAADAVKSQPESGGRRIIVRTFPDRDTAFAKLFAQRVTRMGVPAVALVGSTVDPPGIVFAQSTGGTADMGALMKQVLSAAGGRGGGSRDFAQGGVPAGSSVEQILKQAATTIGN